MLTIKHVYEAGDWLTAEEIDRFQKSSQKMEVALAANWKRSGRVFSVLYNDKEYYARYQFDALYQPLPIIADILDAYGAYVDTWSVAAWFYFPNSWIVDQHPAGMVPTAPMNALERRTEVINAAHKRKGTYVS
jgi:hypothetical protein